MLTVVPNSLPASGTLFDADRVRAVHEALAMPSLRDDSARLVSAALSVCGGSVAIASLVGDRRMVIINQIGTLENLPVAWTGPLARTIFGAVVDAAKPLTIEDTRQHPLFRHDPLASAGCIALVATPIVNPDGKVVGVLAVGDAHPRRWSPAQRDALTSLTQRPRQGIHDAAVQSPFSDPPRDGNTFSLPLHVPCLTIDTDLRVVAVHPDACHELPALAQIRVGQDLRTVDATIRDSLIEAVQGAMAKPAVQIVEWHDKQVDRWFELHAERDLRGIAIDVRDISRWKTREAELIRAAYHDPLTGLPNRRLLMDRLHQALAHARREDHVVAVLFLDLDNFKQINDRFGHDRGDQLLVEVARRLEESLREEDTAARLGGDEFVIVLPDVTNHSGAVEVAQRIIQALHEPLPEPFAGATIATSLGIALSNGTGNTADELLHLADSAMYDAKTRGKDQFRVYGSDADTVERHPQASIPNRCPAGIVPYFQPQMSLATGAIVAVEALARWRHPSRGLLEARQIIPLAAQSGLIVDLGQHVFAQACRDLMQVATRLETQPLELRMNISTAELMSAQFSERLQEIAADHAFPLHLLTVEVNESDLLSTPGISAPLASLVNLGVTIALDNATLQRIDTATLRDLPIGEICLASSVVTQVDRDIDATVRAAGIVSLARSWGITVVAKGVERRQQLEQLALIGCSRAQGFFIGHPESFIHIAGWGSSRRLNKSA